MLALLWTGLIGGSMGAGAALGVLLVVARPREGVIMVGGVASMAAGAFAGSRLVAHYDSPALTVVASVLALAALGGGFALVSALLAYVRPPSIDTPLPAPESPARALVVLMAEVESEYYRPFEVTREIAEFVDAGLPEPTLGVTPFHYAAQKARYRAVGGRSPEHAAARNLAERIEARLDRAAFARPCIVRCSDQGALPSLLAAARSEGYARAVVVGAYVAEGFRAISQRRDLDDIGGALQPLRVVFTPPLWTSDELARLVASSAVAIAADASVTGVALLVHGQPGSHATTNAEFDVQENAFANRVRLFLAEHGLDEARIRVCSAEWSDPGVTETVRHLAALGAERILVVPACYPFPNLQTLLDIPAAIRDARVPEAVRVVQIPPWGEDDVFAEVLASEIERATAEASASGRTPAT